MKLTDMFRKRIKAYLRTHRMRAYELAKKAKVPQACIYEFLREKKGLQTSTMDKIEKAMK